MKNSVLKTCRCTEMQPAENVRLCGGDSIFLNLEDERIKELLGNWFRPFGIDHLL